MPNSLFLGQPCSYGGLIYAFNSTTLRLWRPDNMTGSAVCIPDTMGFGTNSQAARNGKLIFRVFQIYGKYVFSWIDMNVHYRFLFCIDILFNNI